MTRRLGIVWLAVALFTSPALAEGRRVALVIGNDAYANEAALFNAVRDADLVAEAFRRLGFEVTPYHNLDNRALRTALQRFEGAAEGADVAAIYFAGHGVAVDGHNWLLPVDARLEDVRHLDDEAVPDTRLTAAVDAARGLQLVILDACRKNPFVSRLAGRSGGRSVQDRGLEPIPERELPSNRLIAFSAHDGQIAQDGPRGSNGPFAVSLSRRLLEPGVEIGMLFRRVHDDVVAATRPATQVPWTYGNLGGQELYLLAPPALPTPPGDRDALFWQSAERGGSAADYEAYLRAYPNGAFAALARNRLAVLVPPPPPASGYPVPVGQSFRDCNDGTCPEMVVISAGRFLMGSPVSEPGRYGDEGPQHEVTLRAPLAVGKYDVTFAEWDACVAAGGCGGYRPGDQGWGRGRRPVINVSWDDAQVYVRWLSGRTGRGYRLLTEAEWEYAARAGMTTAYPWGDGIGRGNANCDGCGSSWDNKQTAPVGSFPPNRFGLHDMAGNVWQWVSDCYRNSYAGVPSDASETVMDNNCSARVLRGGSWGDDPQDLRAADRGWYAPGDRIDNIGFRLARTPAP